MTILKYLFVGVGGENKLIILSKNPISFPVRSSAALVPNNSGNVCNNKFSYAVKNFFQYCDFGSSVVVFFRCAIYCLTYFIQLTNFPVSFTPPYTIFFILLSVVNDGNITYKSLNVDNFSKTRSKSISLNLCFSPIVFPVALSFFNHSNDTLIA